MAFIPTPNCVMATVQYTGPNSAIAVNRFYCATISVPTEADLEDVADAFTDWLISEWAPISSDVWQATAVTARAMNEAEGLEFNQTALLPVDGALGSDTDIPNQVTGTVTLNTGLVGRSARGRTYIVGINGSVINQFRLSDAGQANYQSAYEALRADLETRGHALQVVSFFEDSVPRTEGRALPVVSVNARFPIATQRRRLS